MFITCAQLRVNLTSFPHISPILKRFLTTSYKISHIKKLLIHNWPKPPALFIERNFPNQPKRNNLTLYTTSDTTSASALLVRVLEFHRPFCYDFCPMGKPIPEPPPDPGPPPWPWPPSPEPPSGCPEIPASYTKEIIFEFGGNLCLVVPCVDQCVASWGLYFWVWWPLCPACAYAVYYLESCSCFFDEFGDGFTHYFCNYQFAGCSSREGELPPAFYFDDAIAFRLAVVYGFSPIAFGKYEPDRGASTLRTFLLANYHDKTNILVRFNVDEFLP